MTSIDQSPHNWVVLVLILILSPAGVAVAAPVIIVGQMTVDSKSPDVTAHNVGDDLFIDFHFRDDAVDTDASTTSGLFVNPFVQHFIVGSWSDPEPIIGQIQTDTAGTPDVFTAIAQPNIPAGGPNLVLTEMRLTFTLPTGGALQDTGAGWSIDSATAHVFFDNPNLQGSVLLTFFNTSTSQEAFLEGTTNLVGVWIPEPATAALLLPALATLRRRRTLAV